MCNTLLFLSNGPNTGGRTTVGDMNTIGEVVGSMIHS